MSVLGHLGENPTHRKHISEGLMGAIIAAHVLTTQEYQWLRGGSPQHWMPAAGCPLGGGQAQYHRLTHGSHCHQCPLGTGRVCGNFLGAERGHTCHTHFYLMNGGQAPRFWTQCGFYFYLQSKEFRRGTIHPGISISIGISTSIGVGIRMHTLIHINVFVQVIYSSSPRTSTFTRLGVHILQYPSSHILVS